MQLIILMFGPIIAFMVILLAVYGVLRAFGVKSRPLTIFIFALIAVSVVALCIVALSFGVLSNTSLG